MLFLRNCLAGPAVTDTSARSTCTASGFTSSDGATAR